MSVQKEVRSTTKTVMKNSFLCLGTKILMSAKKKMEDIVAERPHLKETNFQNVIQENNDKSVGGPILPAISSFFMIAIFKGIKKTKIKKKIKKLSA